MSNITLFQGKRIRVEIKDGEPFFCVKDICDDLGLQSEEAQRRLRNTGMGKTHPGIIATINTETDTGTRAMAYVNEAGLYEIVAGSRKAKARELFSQIVLALPALRQGQGELAELRERIEKLERGGGHLLMRPVPEIDARSRLNIIIRKFIARQVEVGRTYSYPDAWNELYFQHKYRYHIDLKERARKREKKSSKKFEPLDCASPEELEGLVDLANLIFYPEGS